jgi:hypothetical protein
VASDGGAIPAVAVTLLLTIGVARFLRPGIFLFSTATIAAVSSFAGPGPSVLAARAVNYFLIEPVHSLAASPADIHRHVVRENSLENVYGGINR